MNYQQFSAQSMQVPGFAVYPNQQFSPNSHYPAQEDQSYSEYYYQYQQGGPYMPQAVAPPQEQFGYVVPHQQYFNNLNRNQLHYGRGNTRSRGRTKGRVSNSGYRDQVQGHGRSHGSNDPNVDEENQNVSNSEQYSRKVQHHGGNNHGNGNYRGRQWSKGRPRSGATGQHTRRQQNKQSYSQNSETLGSSSAGNGNISHDSDSVSTGAKEQMTQSDNKTSVIASEPNNCHRESRSHNKVQRSNRVPGQRRNFTNHSQNKEEDAESQRDSLIEQLSNNTYECMVCYDIIRRDAAVWSCGNCYHVYHLRCLKRWVRSSREPVEGGGEGWRCPACQNVNKQFPSQYRCFCGKVRDPDTNRFEVPHSCGEVCGKRRPHGCTHPCNILCHPGPCPPCSASVMKHCDCGKTKKNIKCGQAFALKCTSKCEKTLNCGQHECQRVCHGGPCDPCQDQIKQKCYCEKVSRTVLCGTSESFNKSFSCEQVCNRLLDCSNHSCKRLCHPGVCDSCDLSPSVLSHCPCGKVLLKDLEVEARKKCTDPIPVCGNVCGKNLSCGPKDLPHTCKMPCHEGLCGACALDSELICRCGRLTKEFSCKEAVKFTDEDPFTCDHRCNKKRNCGKHKCGKQCCIDSEHICDQICGRKLTCGLHRCEEQCHRNNCPTCWHVSFEELRCYCGQEVIYPPIPCGTKPPECHKPCTKEHACGHVVRHNCNRDDRCPPCTELTQKWCMGGHELRKNIPCHRMDISCGMPCGKELPCGLHKCQQICHKGPCFIDGEVCSQACPKLREACGHPCSQPCHGSSPCPNTMCHTEVMIRCDCGNRSERTKCLLGGEETNFLRMETGMLAMTISNTMDGQSLDLGAMMKEANKKKARKLECSQECSIKERNKRLALALEIKNPDLSSKLGNPTYTQFLKDYAKQYTTFVASVERDLSNLVKTAEGSKQSKRSHAFKSMNSNQRRLIHELAEYYGCDTQSYDEEPNKNVVATAHRGKCFHPNVSLTGLVQRELHPKAPTPIPHHGKEEEIRSTVMASKQSTSVLGAWGKLRPMANDQAPAQTTPSAWGAVSSGATARGSNKSDTPGVAGGSGLKLKSMSVLRKSSTEEKNKPKGRSSPVIDYFDMS